jgi:putative nucleotidyltransferase with HDIG domain
MSESREKTLMETQNQTGFDLISLQGVGILGKEDSNEGNLAEKSISKEIAKMRDDRLRNVIESVVKSMLKIVEKKDPYTARHEKHVSKLASVIGRELGLPDEKVEEIRMTALIHDIGKIFIPSEILVKPGFLTEEEFAFIKLHTYHGYDILKTIDFPWNVASVVLQHHERFNGSGYPERLKGDEIMIEARILAVADVVEAITFHRPYRPGYGLETALQEISSKRGILYDPEIVDVCLKIFRDGKFRFENN